MNVETLAIEDVKLLTPRRFADTRGWFSEVFSVPRMEAAGLPTQFAQDNQSLSVRQGTIRGLHCQVAPFVQGKLVRVVRGAVWDVAIDIRHGSPSFGQHAAAVLSAENGAQLWVPGGFLHGFVTLEPECEVLYKVTAGYDRASERGVAWNDPQLAVPWPIDPGEAILSEKDAMLPLLADCAPWFHF